MAQELRGVLQTRAIHVVFFLPCAGSYGRADTPAYQRDPARFTGREIQIARLASDGLFNPEIAALVFMSPRTVEYHPHKVFAKLGITSRDQLHGCLVNTGKDAGQTNS
jgi:DNA-binding NarL/FixJ family response regulator